MLMVSSFNIVIPLLSHFTNRQKKKERKKMPARFLGAMQIVTMFVTLGKFVVKKTKLFVPTNVMTVPQNTNFIPIN